MDILNDRKEIIKFFMQNFSQKDIQKLESVLGIKKNPGKYEKKLWEKVAKYNTLFQKVPGISCMCICNSLAMNACHKNSDIDLFIITKKNRLWTARIFSTFLLSILGERKTSKNHAGKFCLSFFISETEENFLDIFIENDIYLDYWIKTLRPIINRQQSFEKFLEKNKLSQNINTKQSFSEKMTRNIPEKKILRLFGDMLENCFKKIFLPRTKKSFKKLGKPFGVIISDTMLKFHDQDKRKEIRDTIV